MFTWCTIGMQKSSDVATTCRFLSEACTIERREYTVLVLKFYPVARVNAVEMDGSLRTSISPVMCTNSIVPKLRAGCLWPTRALACNCGCSCRCGGNIRDINQLMYWCKKTLPFCKTVYFAATKRKGRMRDTQCAGLTSSWYHVQCTLMTFDCGAAYFVIYRCVHFGSDL